MDTSLYVNLSYQSSLTRRLELIANNIANLNTAGFKAERAMFDEASFASGPNSDIAFVIDRASYTDFQTGSIYQTGNQLDVAVVGDGWLQVETPEGPRFTRDGRMVISPNQELTNVDGSPVLDRAGARIQIPEQARSITVSKQGTVSIQLEGEPLPIEIGDIAIYDIDDPQNLVREASNRFAGDVEASLSEEAGLQQFAVERSNINPIKEITKLLELSRAYSKVSTASDEIHQTKKDSVDRLGRNG